MRKVPFTEILDHDVLAGITPLTAIVQPCRMTPWPMVTLSPSSSGYSSRIMDVPADDRARPYARVLADRDIADHHCRRVDIRRRGDLGDAPAVTAHQVLTSSAHCTRKWRRCGCAHALQNKQVKLAHAPQTNKKARWEIDRWWAIG